MGKFRTLVNELAEVWKTQMEAKREQKERYRIVYAFTSGGRRYYQYEDIRNIPYQRGMAALAIYNEVQMRCSREFLLKFAEAIDKALEPPSINIYQVKELNGLLKDRLALVADMELCYKLASCVFFDKTEKPEVYEPEYAAKKVERWKKERSAQDFFSQKPIMELVPFLANVTPDVNTYTQLNQELNKLHEDLIRMHGSINSKKSTKAGSH